MEQAQVLVIDGQGGKMGRQLVEAIRKALPEIRLLAVGTNSAAAAAMLKAGADQAATGENAVIVCCRHAQVVVGPIGIVIADSLLGEITPAMAVAVGRCDARKVLLPVNRCGNVIVGVGEKPMSVLIEEAVEDVCAILKNRE